MKAAYIFVLLLLCVTHCQAAHCAPQLTKQQFKAIGNKIWKNEAGQSKEKLTWWLENEDWASLGIGHFIWYPQDSKIERTQTFPDLLLFLQKNKIKLPEWLEQTMLYCPWKTKEAFFADFNKTNMIELRELLASTIDLQTEFIINRFSHTLENLCSATKKTQHNHLITQYHRVANCPNGLYILIDYVNFKGEGINKKERYNNQGWGLLQVLENMNGSSEKDAAAQFATTAKRLLAQRVNNAKNKKENGFLLGWNNRINTYLEPLLSK